MLSKATVKVTIWIAEIFLLSERALEFSAGLWSLMGDEGLGRESKFKE
jgi:hypothetical protein